MMRKFFIVVAGLTLLGCNDERISMICEGSMESLQRGTCKDGFSSGDFRDEIVFSRREGIWSASHSAHGSFERKFGFTSEKDYDEDVDVGFITLRIHKRSNPARRFPNESNEEYLINRFTGTFRAHYIIKSVASEAYLVSLQYKGACKRK